MFSTRESQESLLLKLEISFYICPRIILTWHDHINNSSLYHEIVLSHIIVTYLLFKTERELQMLPAW